MFLDQETVDIVKVSIYHQLGNIKYCQEEYTKVLSYYEKSVAIAQKSLPANHSKLKNWKDDFDRIKHQM